MVGVRVGVDHGCHRARAQMLVGEIERRLGRLVRAQRVDHDPAGIPLHEGDVGEIKAAHLPDTLAHLEEPMLCHQLGLPPQAGVHGVGRRLPQKVEGGEIPDRLASRRRDHRVLAGCDEAARHEVEIARVREIALVAHHLVRRTREGRRRLGSCQRRCRGRSFRYTRTAGERQRADPDQQCRFHPNLPRLSV